MGGRWYSSYSYLTSALGGGEWSVSRPGRSLPPGKEPPVPLGQEARWAPEPVWTQGLEEKSSAPVWDRTPIVQPVVRHCTSWAASLANTEVYWKLLRHYQPVCDAVDLWCTPCGHRNIGTLRGARSNLLRLRSPSCPAGSIPHLRCSASRVEADACIGQHCKSVSFFVSFAVLTSHWPTCRFAEYCCFRGCGANMEFRLIFSSCHQTNKYEPCWYAG
jgi:hypothetical protein